MADNDITAVIEKLYNILTSFGFPVIVQGCLGDNEYPESFFTYYNNETTDDSFYDNDPKYTIWDFDVNFYSLDPMLVNKKLIEAINKLKENGFIVDGKGHDIGSDEPTHTGRGVQVQYVESN